MFAVKASRYITHLKKLRDVDEALDRFIDAAAGLGKQLGPCLYQLPPHWRADPSRLEQFVARLPRQYRAAFEFRDPSWYRPEVARILGDAGCAVVIAVGGALSSPPDAPRVGPFGYIRFHHGAHGVGFSRAELEDWAERLAATTAQGHDVYVYFNNDPEGHAVADARTLRELRGSAAVQPTHGKRSLQGEPGCSLRAAIARPAAAHGRRGNGSRARRHSAGIPSTPV